MVAPIEMKQEPVEEDPVDFAKFSMEERAELLPVPTDDTMAEFNKYKERMGYTPERMKSIRYKMEVFDEFWKEYEYRKRKSGFIDEHPEPCRNAGRGAR